MIECEKEFCPKASSYCLVKDWKKDGECDDGNNNPGCEWDGGDCCGDKIKKDWCKDCICWCKDADNVSATCPQLAKYGFCLNSANSEWVKANCKKSCGLC